MINIASNQFITQLHNNNTLTTESTAVFIMYISEMCYININHGTKIIHKCYIGTSCPDC